jgi:hypothetical protein
VPASPSNDLPVADELVAAVRRRHGIDLPHPEVDPVRFEEHLTSKNALVAALAEAGLADLSVRTRRYNCTVTVDDYLSGWGGLCRHLRYTIGERRWSNAVQDAAVVLRDRFGHSFSRAHDVRIAVGRRE